MRQASIHGPYDVTQYSNFISRSIMKLLKFFILFFFFNSIGLSKSQPTNTERKKNVLENKKPFLFAEKVTINTSERGMKFGGEGRGI